MNSWTWMGSIRKGMLHAQQRLQKPIRWTENRGGPGEDLHPWEAGTLDGMPVLIGGMHSMLPIALSWTIYRCAESGVPAPHVVYVMTDDALLSPALSRHVTALRRLGWLSGTITYGGTRGGDLWAADKQTALLAARHALHADVTIVCKGAGVTVPCTRISNPGNEAAEFLETASRLGAASIVIPRVSFFEDRDGTVMLERHMVETAGGDADRRGLLPIAVSVSDWQNDMIREKISSSGLDRRLQVKWIDSIRDEEVERALAQYPYSISAMGRTFTRDPAYYRCVCAAAQSALEHWLAVSSH